MELSQNSSHYVYRECLRNHAASLGSYATDGCGEFTVDEETSLQCAACGCHRNFHRKVVTAPTESHNVAMRDTSGSAGAVGDQLVEYSDGGGGWSDGRRKRYRTKFTVEQKEKMMGFAERLGWKLQRKELDEEIERFCESVGVSRQVFKVWMHNHKNNNNSSSTSNNNSSAAATNSTGIISNASSLTTQ